MTEQAASKFFLSSNNVLLNYLVDAISSTTHPCGLVIDQTAPHPRCNSDTVVMESSNDIVSYGILECKCVYADPNVTCDNFISVREHFCLERSYGRLRLRTGHPYFYQLIALMGILDLPWIDICIMKCGDIHIQRFVHDESVWLLIKQKLTNFYFNFFLYHLIKFLSLNMIIFL